MAATQSGFQSSVGWDKGVAPDLFLVPMDWLMERTVHGGMIGITIGKKKESFTDLDFADDVVLLAEMLSVLVLALEVMDREAQLWTGKHTLSACPDSKLSILSIPSNSFQVLARDAENR